MYGGAFWTKMQSNRHFNSIGSDRSCIPLDRRSIPLDRSFLPLDRYFHSIGSYFHSIGSYLSSIGSYLSSIRSYFNYFVASYCPECPSIRIPVSPSIGSPLQRFCIFRSVQLQMVIFDFEEERDWNRACCHSNVKMCHVSHHCTCSTYDVIYDVIICIIGKLEYVWNKKRCHKKN